MQRDWSYFSVRSGLAAGTSKSLVLMALAAHFPVVAGGNQSEGAAEWATSPPPVSLPMIEDDVFAGVPNLEIVHYDVVGKSVAEIRKAMDRQGLRDPNDGKHVDALTEWRINWRWSIRDDGRCDLTLAETRFEATVRLPRLIETPALPQSVRDHWNRFLAKLKRHEANHVRAAWLNSGKVLSAIRASSCENVEAAAQAVIVDITQIGIEYDRTSKHGRSEGVTFP